MYKKQASRPRLRTNCQHVCTVLVSCACAVSRRKAHYSSEGCEGCLSRIHLYALYVPVHDNGRFGRGESVGEQTEKRASPVVKPMSGSLMTAQSSVGPPSRNSASTGERARHF